MRYYRLIVGFYNNSDCIKVGLLRPPLRRKMAAYYFISVLKLLDHYNPQIKRDHFGYSFQ